VEEVKIPKGQTGLEVKTSGWKKGLYVVRAIGGTGTVANGKIVVE